MLPTEKTISQPTFYSVSDIQQLLGIGRNNAYRLVSRSDFPAIHVGNRIIIPLQRLMDCLMRLT